MAGKGKIANRERKNRYRKLAEQRRTEQRTTVTTKTPTSTPEITRAKILRSPDKQRRSEKYLLESSAETYFEKTPATVYGSSRKPISITTSYINQEGKLPYIEITTKIIGSQLPPFKIREFEERLQFEAILMTSSTECDIVRQSEIQKLFQEHEATQDPQIRDQLSGIEKTFENNILEIRGHLAGTNTHNYDS